MRTRSQSPAAARARTGLARRVVVLGILLAAGAVIAGPLRVAAFRCEATPPLGEPLLWATNQVKTE